MSLLITLALIPFAIGGLLLAVILGGAAIVGIVCALIYGAIYLFVVLERVVKNKWVKGVGIALIVLYFLTR